MLTEQISLQTPENALYIDCGSQPQPAVTGNIGLEYSAAMWHLYTSCYWVPQFLCFNMRQEISWPSLLYTGGVQSYGLSETMAGKIPSVGAPDDQPEAEPHIKSENSSNTMAHTEDDHVSTDLTHIRKYNGYSNVTRCEDGLFHCPWEGQANCKHRPHKQRRALRRYIECHLKPHRCTICKACLASRSSLLRHERRVHGCERVLLPPRQA